MLRIHLFRFRSSYDFRVRAGVDSFENNWKNNSLDLLSLLDGDKTIFSARCQSVANYCFGSQRPGDTVKEGDTIRKGTFSLKCFVEPRSFHGEIHAITNTADLDGQIINHEAMQTTVDGYQNGRWLVHDRFSFKSGCDTHYAWSAGCVILSAADLTAFNYHLKACDVKSGDILSGIVEENQWN